MSYFYNDEVGISLYKANSDLPIDPSKGMV